MTSPRRWAAVGVLVAAAGCGGAKLRGRADGIRELLATARNNGALRCAPVELAMAEAHHDFARQELAEGNYYSARRELGVAEVNARAAVRKSPIERCNPGQTKKVAVAAKPGDSDGDGITDDVDGCPRNPEDEDGFEDEDGCPEADNDNDGLTDAVDKCPLKPEDKDGFEDADGCPEEDNDGDGLNDHIDECPDDAEDPDGFEDEDGCPDCDNDKDGVPECPQLVDRCPSQPAKTEDGCPKYERVEVTASKIELKESIYFATGKAVIRRVSHPLLDEVAAAMRDHAHIRVRIEGHTDSRGRRRYNLRLSQARAEAVREYLIQRGISPERMVARGFGETVPIADNRTDAGRSQNRRVDFVIIDQ